MNTIANRCKAIVNFDRATEAHIKAVTAECKALERSATPGYSNAVAAARHLVKQCTDDFIWAYTMLQVFGGPCPKQKKGR